MSRNEIKQLLDRMTFELEALQYRLTFYKNQKQNAWQGIVECRREIRQLKRQARAA